MAVATEQLETIHQELTQTFGDGEMISIVALDGNPPDKYEVTYQVEGLQKNTSDEIETVNGHTITLSIPFGYPHFPPSCKPKSPIFHPDFDPAAICIGDFWEKNRSIIDLIRHIGEMITGRFYSTSNAFNEEAAQWYEKNKAKLPGSAESEGSASDDLLGEEDFGSPAGDDISSLLDDDTDDLPFSLDDDLPAALVDDETQPALNLAEAPEQKKKPQLEDIESISFDESDFDFGPADDPGEVASSASAQSDFSGDLELEHTDEAEEETVEVEYLLALADQKRYFALDKELEQLPAAADFTERDGLTRQVKETLARVKVQYQEALELEHQGSPAEALKLFKEIEKKTPDFPALHDDIDRITQAIKLLGDWTEPSRKEKPVKDEFVGDTAAEDESPARPETKKQARKQENAAPTFFDDGSSRQGSRLIPYAIGIIFVLIAFAAGFNYWLSASNLKQARRESVECEKAIKGNQFTLAEQKCEAALGAARQILFFKSGARDALIRDVEQTLASEPLRQGLAGKLSLDGEYYPKDVVNAILSFRQFKQAGDYFFTGENWQQAMSNYEQALTIGQGEKAIGRSAMLDITNNIKIAEFNILYQSGISFIERKKWVLATKDLSAALQQLKGLSINDKDQKIDAITARLSEIAQATEKEKGDLAFEQGQWDQAASHYKKALSTAQDAADPDERAIYELKQLLVKTELYTTVSSGKDAFRKAQWDTAISLYQKAIEILESNREILQQANTEENRQKLARIMLQASIIRDRQAAAGYLKEKQYTEAVDTLQTILDSISASSFKTEAEFVSIFEEAQRDIEQAKVDLVMAEKINYLEENFETLFTKHYSGSPPESLVDRIVVFENEKDGKLIFRLQCVEVGRGRPLQLIMKYAHDPVQGTWSFYSDSN
jgi:ubiquitin-protein ligase